MEDKKKLDVDVNESVECSGEEMKKLRDEDISSVSGGTVNWDLTGDRKEVAVGSANIVGYK